MYSQRVYKANEGNKKGLFGLHKGEICRFFEWKSWFISQGNFA